MQKQLCRILSNLTPNAEEPYPPPYSTLKSLSLKVSYLKNKTSEYGELETLNFLESFLLDLYIFKTTNAHSWDHFIGFLINNILVQDCFFVLNHLIIQMVVEKKNFKTVEQFKTQIQLKLSQLEIVEKDPQLFSLNKSKALNNFIAFPEINSLGLEKIYFNYVMHNRTVMLQNKFIKVLTEFVRKQILILNSEVDKEVFAGQDQIKLQSVESNSEASSSKTSFENWKNICWKSINSSQVLFFERMNIKLQILDVINRLEPKVDQILPNLNTLKITKKILKDLQQLHYPFRSNDAISDCLIYLEIITNNLLLYIRFMNNCDWSSLVGVIFKILTKYQISEDLKADIDFLLNHIVVQTNLIFHKIQRVLIVQSENSKYTNMESMLKLYYLGMNQIIYEYQKLNIQFESEQSKDLRSFSKDTLKEIFDEYSCAVEMALTRFIKLHLDFVGTVLIHVVEKREKELIELKISRPAIELNYTLLEKKYSFSSKEKKEIQSDVEEELHAKRDGMLRRRSLSRDLLSPEKDEVSFTPHRKKKFFKNDERNSSIKSLTSTTPVKAFDRNFSTPSNTISHHSSYSLKNASKHNMRNSRINDLLDSDIDDVQEVADDRVINSQHNKKNSAFEESNHNRTRDYKDFYESNLDSFYSKKTSKRKVNESNSNFIESQPTKPFSRKKSQVVIQSPKKKATTNKNLHNSGSATKNLKLQTNSPTINFDVSNSSISSERSTSKRYQPNNFLSPSAKKNLRKRNLKKNICADEKSSPTIPNFDVAKDKFCEGCHRLCNCPPISKKSLEKLRQRNNFMKEPVTFSSDEDEQEDIDYNESKNFKFENYNRSLKEEIDSNSSSESSYMSNRKRRKIAKLKETIAESPKKNSIIANFQYLEMFQKILFRNDLFDRLYNKKPKFSWTKFEKELLLIKNSKEEKDEELKQYLDISVEDWKLVVIEEAARRKYENTNTSGWDVFQSVSEV
ncbi:hypothetical protein HDU92_007302 [Lobulomyces angularis]|nr:hypothetical protein HDU92_007302 [Lobulomyces angularis]